MKASVLILIHDEEVNHVEKCVYSIINQTYKNLEIVVIDDSNKVELSIFFEKLEKKHNINYIKYNQKISLPNARNLGISKCKGKYVFLQDSDDWSEPFRIQTQLEYLENGIDICCGLTNYFSSSGKYIFSSSQSEDLIEIKKNEIIKNNHVAIGSVAFRKEIFNNNYNIFRQELKFCDDMDFVLRNSNKFKFFQINKKIYNYRFNKKSSTLNTNDELQPFLDFYILQEMYQTQNFNIEDVKSKVISTKKKYINYKNKKQRISYMIYSGNYKSAIMRADEIKLIFYSILLTVKVILLKLKNKL